MNRHAAPLGTPCWVDLRTSDIEGSRQSASRYRRFSGAVSSPWGRAAGGGARA